tara:strand:- start:189 stop:989 length:801 start_codon:yes stop_codon:yes gene_type:complete
MQRIIYFLIRNKELILFLSLFITSLSININFNDYRKSKFINSSNFIIASIYDAKNSITKYFDLISQNKLLIEENRALRHLILNEEKKSSEKSKSENFNFNVISTSVIKNSYSNSNNFITIDKGIKQGVKIDNGVISSKGVVGIIDKSSKNYSRFISILNTNFLLNAKLKKSGYFGVLSWDGLNINKVQLKDVPKQADVSIGDTIVTGGNSLIFPKGILVGFVDSYKVDSSKNYLEIEINLSTDMTNIQNLYIIQNNNIKEINSLNE